MPWTDTGKNSALDAFVTTEGTLYVALIRTGGTEASGVGSGGTAYARKAITWGAASSGTKSNSVAVVFDNGGATDWSNDIDKWKIYDALSGGNELQNGTLSASRDMSVANATLTFAIGAIDLTLT